MLDLSVKLPPKMSKVNLDALIPRDDFSTTTSSELESSEQFNNIGILSLSTQYYSTILKKTRLPKRN